MKMIEKARLFAEEKHRGQRYGDESYMIHIDHVVATCKRFNLYDKIIIAAYLHDILEDTSTTFKELVHEFGYSVAVSVQSVTDEPGISRNERKAKSWRKILSNPDGIYIKLADRIANIEACIDSDIELLRMYVYEHDKFKYKLKIDRVADVMWDTLDKLIENAKKIMT